MVENLNLEDRDWEEVISQKRSSLQTSSTRFPKRSLATPPGSSVGEARTTSAWWCRWVSLPEQVDVQGHRPSSTSPARSFRGTRSRKPSRRWWPGEVPRRVRHSWGGVRRRESATLTLTGAAKDIRIGLGRIVRVNVEAWAGVSRVVASCGANIPPFWSLSIKKGIHLGFLNERCTQGFKKEGL